MVEVCKQKSRVDVRVKLMVQPSAIIAVLEKRFKIRLLIVNLFFKDCDTLEQYR